MTKSASFEQQTILEQLADAIQNPDLDSGGPAELQQLVARVMTESRSWNEALLSSLVDNCGVPTGEDLARLFRGGFPAAYRTRFPVSEAVRDIQQIQSISSRGDVPMRFYDTGQERDGEVRFKLYSQGHPVVLSDVIPILENLGMRVLGEHPYNIQRCDGECFGVSDFTVELNGRGADADLPAVRPLLQEAFREIWNGRVENDEFNRLILVSGLAWREVALLRAYSRYIKQLRFGFSQPFIADTLSRHLGITSLLVNGFRARFEPGIPSPDRRQAVVDRFEKQVLEALEGVESLDDDRILRRFYALIWATLRTNYYLTGDDGACRDYLSLKFEPTRIPDIPKPCPQFEVFVYSPRVEGVHLRAGRVARGGLRWSDRSEDYRTEILGLVKAQQVKNSVIVPVGAKGGFVVKQPPQSDSREALLAEGVSCYRTFIRGLLDITDNIVGGEVVPPTGVVRHDEDDPYLVVAADKGTATFSDIANELAGEYGFWLGDAFASGGSEGYDHKKMGITARGAWESVKRHFLEKGMDTQSELFTVVGVGDMAGDVFGNGMLLSDKIRLVGAFNHRHIFIDPDPDAAASFEERRRLFELPGSSWADYDPERISAGGGVFARSLKWIALTPQMQACLGTEAVRLSPAELISALLKAPVDMLWNGGIGTYVKAPQESHEDVGDKSNDAVRVDSTQLRCKVLGEGGNLGVTQLGRIGFAAAGGAANTDFIDNAGGVDCSDHEVNIKILLNELVQQGRMTLEDRNGMLREMTPEVAALVLKNNYRQALALSLATASAATSVDEHERLIRRLESEGKLDRALEFLPADDEIQARKSRSTGLTRPELSVLVSYAKIELKQALLDSPIVHDHRFAAALYSAFPPALLADFRDAVDGHPLRAEIAATQIANDMVNRMGIAWADKVRHATGADHADVAAAYLVACDIYDIDAQWATIEALDGVIASPVQAELFGDLIRLVTRCSSWLLNHRRHALDPESCRQRYQPSLAGVLASPARLASVIPESRWHERCEYYREAGVPVSVAAPCASAESRYWLMDIVEVALQQGRELEAVAWVYFRLGETLALTWLDQQMRAFHPRGHWQVLATLHFRNELDQQLKNLTSSVFGIVPGHGDTPQQLLDGWREGKQVLLKRWQTMLDEMQAAKVIDCAVFSVAHGVLRELAAEAA